jgi:hypothetical protein
MGAEQTKHIQTPTKFEPPKPLEKIYKENDEQTHTFKIQYGEWDKEFFIFAFAVANRAWLQNNQFWSETEQTRRTGSYKLMLWSNSSGLDCSRMYNYLRRLVDKFIEPLVIVCYDYPGYGISRPYESYELGFDYVNAVSALTHMARFLQKNVGVLEENIHFVGHEVGARVIVDGVITPVRVTIKNPNFNPYTIEDYVMKKSPLMLIVPDDCLLKRFCQQESSNLDDKFVPSDNIKDLNNPIKIVQYRSYFEPLHMCTAQQAFTYLKYPLNPLWIRDDDIVSDMWPFSVADAKGIIVDTENIIFFIGSETYKDFMNTTKSYFSHENDSDRRKLSDQYKLECQENAKKIKQDDF